MIVTISDNRIGQHCTSRGGKPKQQKTCRYGILSRIGQGKPENNPGIKGIIQRRVQKNAEIAVFPITGNGTVQGIKSAVDKNAQQSAQIHPHCQKVNCQQSDGKTDNTYQIGRHAGFIKITADNIGQMHPFSVHLPQFFADLIVFKLGYQPV